MDILHKVIEFKETKVGHYDTVPFDPGMQARVIEYNEKENGTCTVKLDMSEFIKENEKKMIPNWEDRMGQKILKWNRTKFYPTDQIATVTYYVENPPFELR